MAERTTYLVFSNPVPGKMSGAMGMSDALDLETVAMSFWRPIGERVVKPERVAR